MSKNIKLIKGKVVIQDRFSSLEEDLVTTKYRDKEIFEFWRTNLKTLSFLKELRKISDLSLVNCKVEDLSLLSFPKDLHRIFLNGVRVTSGWGFLTGLTQVQELHLLNLRGELALPDLQGLDSLKRLRVWGCKGLSDASALQEAPRLEEVELVDTALTPSSFCLKNHQYVTSTPSLKHKRTMHDL